MIAVYLSTGAEIYHKQAALSIFSLLKNTKESVRILVYTDTIEFYSKLDFFDKLECIHVSEAELDAWKQPTNYPYASKLNVIIQALEFTKSAIVFCDTDTIHTRSFEELHSQVNSKTVVFQAFEGSLRSKSSQMLWELAWSLRDSKAINLKTAVMYNTGVLGVHYEHVELLKTGIPLMHTLFLESKKHIAEQLAVSIVLVPFERKVYSPILHYWHCKSIINEQLDKGVSFESCIEFSKIHCSNFQYDLYKMTWPEFKTRIKIRLGFA